MTEQYYSEEVVHTIVNGLLVTVRLCCELFPELLGVMNSEEELAVASQEY